MRTQRRTYQRVSSRYIYLYDLQHVWNEDKKVYPYFGYIFSEITIEVRIFCYMKYIETEENEYL